MIETRLAAMGELIYTELAPPPARAGSGDTTPPPGGAPFDWGLNADGWNVVIHNRSGAPITPWYMGQDMVRKAPRLIRPRGRGSVRGKADPLRSGVPADMRIDLRIHGISNVLAVTGVPGSNGFTAEVYGSEPWAFRFAAFDARRPLELTVLVGGSLGAGERVRAA
ncbi:hypothetical protein [Streptomyces sp. NPDC001594]|uniref:hypothetical protein n=1 Tax=Streptomyces sp. NPDC001594 TaxID=3364590 RepID=UPI0036748393